VGPRAGLE